MEIIFAKQYLKDLHITGKTSEKKHRYQPDIIKRYRKTVDRLTTINNRQHGRNRRC